MKTLQSGKVGKWFVIDVLIRIAGTVVEGRLVVLCCGSFLFVDRNNSIRSAASDLTTIRPKVLLQSRPGYCCSFGSVSLLLLSAGKRWSVQQGAKFAWVEDGLKDNCFMEIRAVHCDGEDCGRWDCSFDDPDWKSLFGSNIRLGCHIRLKLFSGRDWILLRHIHSDRILSNVVVDRGLIKVNLILVTIPNGNQYYDSATYFLLDHEVMEDQITVFKGWWIREWLVTKEFSYVEMDFCRVCLLRI